MDVAKSLRKSSNTSEVFKVPEEMWNEMDILGQNTMK